jgi:hypothetical protein
MGDNASLGVKLRLATQAALQRQLTFRTTTKIKELEKELLKKAMAGKCESLYFKPIDPEVVTILQTKHGIKYSVELNSKTNQKEYWLRW